MAVYPVVCDKTGEEKVVEMSITEWDEWKQSNPEWRRDWSKGCASPGEVGEWRNKLAKKNPGWNDVLKRVSKSPGSTVKPY